MASIPLKTVSNDDVLCSARKHTFEVVFEHWIEFRRLSLKEGRQSTLSQILRTFNKDILPTLGLRSIFDINRHDLLDALGRIE